MAASVHIVDNATPALRSLTRNLDPARVNARIAPAAARLVQDHFAEKESQGNKNGWPSQHFFANCARGTHFDSTEGSATVIISWQGFRQRLQGGVIKPVEKKMLAIPARAEAYGRRAEEFGNLKVQFGRRKDGSIGPVALVAAEGGATKKVFRGREAAGKERKVAGAEEGVVMFWLVLQVTQQPDPTVLPTDAEFTDTAVATVRSYIQRLGR